MTGCPDLAGGAQGLAQALAAVDCGTAAATMGAFARLFGPAGALSPALTLALTLYIALQALGLITGRSRLGVGLLTGRMLTVGLVLAFATSWAAYGQVVFAVATGAPDQLAGAVMGRPGERASLAFANRIDALFSAISDAADEANRQAAERAANAPAGTGAPAPAAQNAGAAGAFSPPAVMWLAAALMLLGTAGVLVASRIVLAVLLALGPVFVVLALFRATRGLCMGWLRALVVAAMAPLLAVLGGNLTLDLAGASARALVGPDGIAPRAAFALFLMACVHVALMALALRTAGQLAGGWRAWGGAGAGRGAPGAPLADPAAAARLTLALPGADPRRHASLTLAASAPAPALGDAPPGPAATARLRAAALMPLAAAPPAPLAGPGRGRGIGSRFRSTRAAPPAALPATPHR